MKSRRTFSLRQSAAIPSLVLCILLASPKAEAQSTGIDEIPTSAPARVEVGEDGLIYATNPWKGTVSIFQPDGSPLDTILVGGRPLGLAVGLDNSVYVGDSDHGSVLVFGPDRKFSHYVGSGNGEFGKPSDIAVSLVGTVYVSDSERNQVRFFKKPGFQRDAGHPLIKKQSGVIYGLQYPTGIAINKSTGELFVMDTGTWRIRVYDLNGKWLRDFGQQAGGGEDIGFVRPQGLAVREDGRLFVSDALLSNIQVLEADGSFLYPLVNLRSSSGLPVLRTPLDVALSSLGDRIYVAEYRGNRISSFQISTPAYGASPTGPGDHREVRK